MNELPALPAYLTAADGLFFPDGNIILQAEGTVFMLYKGLLASKSAVFADMLAFPQPGGEAKSLLGVPLVELYDNAEEATYFLRALTDSSYLPPGKLISFHEVAGVLRLANKYDTPYLVERAIAHIASVYPPTLDAWEHRNEHRTILPTPNLAVGVLLLARERPESLECVLPQVLYAIADGLTVSDIWDGVDFPVDGSNRQGQDGAAGPCKRLEICRADQHALFRAREELLQAKRRRMYAFLTSLSAGCGAMACREEKLKCYAGVAWDSTIFDEEFDWRCFEQRVCRRCFSEGRAAFNIAKESLWTELPRFFGLPKWEALRRLQ